MENIMWCYLKFGPMVQEMLFGEQNTDDERTDDHNSSPCAFGLGELK